MISVALGANLRLSPSDLDRALPTIRSSFAVGYQLENDLDTVLYGLRITREAGHADVPRSRARNPAARRHLSLRRRHQAKRDRGEHPDGHRRPRRRERGRGRRLVRRAGRRSGDRHSRRRRAPSSYEDGHSRHYPAPGAGGRHDRRGRHLQRRFLASLSPGKALGEAIVFANAAAALSTERIGVVESIPEPDAVARLLRTAEPTDGGWQTTNERQTGDEDTSGDEHEHSRAHARRLPQLHARPDSGRPSTVATTAAARSSARHGTAGWASCPSSRRSRCSRRPGIFSPATSRRSRTPRSASRSPGRAASRSRRAPSRPRSVRSPSVWSRTRRSAATGSRSTTSRAPRTTG